MSITFNEDNPDIRQFQSKPNYGIVTKVVLKVGLAANEAQARIVLIAISLCSIIATIFVLLA